MELLPEAFARLVLAPDKPPQAAAPPQAATGTPAGSPSRQEVEFDWFDEEKRLAGLVDSLNQVQGKEGLLILMREVSAFQEVSSIPHIVPYLTHEDEFVFETAVAALENIRAPESARALGAVFSDPTANKERRLRTIEALMFLHAEDGAAGSLAKAMADPDAEVRREATMTLVLTGDDRVPDDLRKALAREDDPENRKLLVRGLEIVRKPLPEAANDGAGS